MGRLGKDPELKYTPGQIPVTSFQIAVDRDFKAKDQERETDWIDIVAWRNTAEFITKYFHKGSQIVIKGSLQTRSYADKNRNKRYVTEVLAEHVYFAGGKREENQLNDVPPTQDDFEEIIGDDSLPF